MAAGGDGSLKLENKVCGGGGVERALKSFIADSGSTQRVVKFKVGMTNDRLLSDHALSMVSRSLEVDGIGELDVDVRSDSE